MNLNKDKKDSKISFQARFMHFTDKAIPIPEEIPDSVKDKPEFLFLKAKFDERPVWLKNSLMVACKEEKIKFESHHQFRKNLSFLAYSCKDGPWKHAYVRFGYDCRAETEAFVFQVLDIGVLDSTSLHENLVQSHKKNEL